MRKPEIIIIEEKKSSPLKVIFAIATFLFALAAAAAALYLYFDKTIRSKIIGEVDIDGDGEADAIMLDTTGDGEVDTIILGTDIEEETAK